MFCLSFLSFYLFCLFILCLHFCFCLSLSLLIKKYDDDDDDDDDVSLSPRWSLTLMILVVRAALVATCVSSHVADTRDTARHDSSLSCTKMHGLDSVTCRVVK